MPSLIVKAAPDQDLYCEWSTIVDAPTFIGTRSEILDYIHAHQDSKPHAPAWERLERADEAGTSARYGKLPYAGSWDDAGFVVEQRGWLPRAKLTEFLTAYRDDNLNIAYALLAPFDTEDAD